MSKLKVGDLVKAMSNNYFVTNKKNQWIGKVTQTSGKYFKAKTIYSKDGSVGETMSLPMDDFSRVYGIRQQIPAIDNEVFNVGDRVRLKSTKEIGVHLPESLHKFCGDCATIIEIDSSYIRLSNFEKNKDEDFMDLFICVGASVLLEKVYNERKVSKKLSRLEKNGRNYGYLGRLTKYRDVRGEPLRVGDVVSVSLNEKHGECAYQSIVVQTNNTPYILGLAESCYAKTGKIVYYQNHIKKIRSFKDIKNGEILSGIKYIVIE